MKPRKSIVQIFINHSSISQYAQITSQLRDDGFTLFHGLDRIRDDDQIIAICVDTGKREVYQANVTVMACWCSQNSSRYPLSGEQFMKNYEGLIKRKDAGLYDRLLRESWQKHCLSSN